MLWRGLVLSLAVVTLGACGKSNSNGDNGTGEDTSASGIAANAVGGALSSSDANGTMALNERRPQPIEQLMALLIPPAYASNACPTVKTSGTGCTNSAPDVNLTYSSCSFGTSLATWNGTLQVSLSNGTAINCGTFPNVASIPINVSIQRQFLTGSNPGMATRTSAFGTLMTIDNASANLANFDTPATISPNIGSGYGTQVVFDGTGKRKQVLVDERIYSSIFDHSITGSLGVSENAGVRTVTGSVTVYHNKLQIVGTSHFNSVTYDNTCCHPTGGSITTTYAHGANRPPTILGAQFVGQTETLTFSGVCGTATFSDGLGDTSTVTESGCF